MEKKINIAKLLKDCPIGTELYSPLCGECRVLNIYDGLGFDVICGDDTVYNFSYDGRYNIMGECCIFPSKENRDWSKFQRPFKDGDIVTCTNEYCTYIAIFKKMKDDNSFYRHAVTYNNEFCCVSNNWSDFNETCRFATEEEKKKLFDVIKANGYKWNEETKTLEKMVEPKFKVGDKIKKVKGYISGIITNITDDGSYKVEYKGGGISYISLAYQYEWELVPNKFDITNLKPFNKVLIRDRNTDEWNCHFFSYYRKNSDTPYVCIGWDGTNEYKQCIPYGENKHLLGTTDDCDEYYKTW